MAHWLKLDTGILQDEKIELIRSLPAGDSLVVMWIGLLCIAMRKETDSLYIAQGVPYSVEGLSKLLKIDHKTVELGLQVFTKYEMITLLDDGGVVINNLHTHQSLDKLIHQRELANERKRRERARKSLPDVTRDTVTCHATELEEDLEVEEEKSTVALTHDRIPYAEIIQYLNTVCGTSYKPETKATRRLIKARWNDGSRLDDFKKVIDSKWKEWGGNAEMVQYLRPQTLFGTKMESYLQKVTPQTKMDINQTTVTGWTCTECGKLNTHSGDMCVSCRSFR